MGQVDDGEILEKALNCQKGKYDRLPYAEIWVEYEEQTFGTVNAPKKPAFLRKI